jgi:hypothetical protein
MSLRREYLKGLCALIIGAAGMGATGNTGTGLGYRFFHETVIPRLAENGCPRCHAVGYIRPNVLRYDELLRRLAIGDSSTNNVVIYKLANTRAFSPDRPNHPGGQRCATPDVEPCRSIQRWWEIEFGAGADP